jgi:predicted metal-dependent hydrolase
MTHLERGIELFNRGSFFEAHEVLEEEWLRAPRPERFFLQGLIHMAVAWHHASQGNPPGALRQVTKGLRKLAGYLPRHAGVDTADLCARALLWREAWAAGAESNAPAIIVFRKT